MPNLHNIFMSERNLDLIFNGMKLLSREFEGVDNEIALDAEILAKNVSIALGRKVKTFVVDPDLAHTVLVNKESIQNILDEIASLKSDTSENNRTLYVSNVLQGALEKFKELGFSPKFSVTSEPSILSVVEKENIQKITDSIHDLEFEVRTAHPCMELINDVLYELLDELNKLGFVPKTK